MGEPVVNGSVVHMGLFPLLEFLQTKNYEGYESVTQTGIQNYTPSDRLGSGGYGTVFRLREDASLARKQIEADEENVQRWGPLLMRLQYGRTAEGKFRPGQVWTFSRPNLQERKGVDFNTCNQILGEMRWIQRQRGSSKLHPVLHWQWSGNLIYLYTPLCDGDLLSFANTHYRLLHIEGCYWKKLVEDLGSAVEYMHSMEVAHLDIKPPNVLVKNRRGEVSFLLSDYDFLRDLKVGHERGKYDTYWMGSGGSVTPNMIYNRIQLCNKTNRTLLSVYLPGVDIFAFASTLLQSLYLPIEKVFAASLGHDWYEPLRLCRTQLSRAQYDMCLVCLQEADRDVVKQKSAFQDLVRWPQQQRGRVVLC